MPRPHEGTRCYRDEPQVFSLRHGNTGRETSKLAAEAAPKGRAQSSATRLHFIRHGEAYSNSVWTLLRYNDTSHLRSE